MIEKVDVSKDQRIDDLLDELADLLEFWKKRRIEGKTPRGIRAAAIQTSEEIQVLCQYQPQYGPFDNFKLKGPAIAEGLSVRGDQ